jgi:hypothetical protein
MTKRVKVLLVIVGAVVCCIGLGIIGLVLLYKQALSFNREVISKTGRAVAYEPKCEIDDGALCAAWKEFRTLHPYPYQSFAVKKVEDEALILIISEPAPALASSELDSLIHATFGISLRIHRLRWYIGADGWLEDVAFRIEPSASSLASPLDDPVLRDRVAALHQALFGTAFGGDLEIIGQSPVEAARQAAPNIHVSPREVATWMTQDSIRWHPVDASRDESLSWSEICTQGAVGAFVAEDNTLVILTFPTTFPRSARNNYRVLEDLRIPFRQFAVASEMVFGGIWTNGGQTAILARIRTHPLSVLPPLRFETFMILAAQSSDELAQSYERNTVFAGKLMSGEYKYKDWAPVYLSAPLIDTEFGALLNITDQMLKSWSQAGDVEYLYFNYPKPEKFPFDAKALSAVLREKHGSRSVLFNWNTAGSAVVVNGDGFSILTVKQTGALPVTYGADGKSKDQGGADVFEYEEEGYQYFAGLGDPNLTRVVQYTTLFQMFRAISKDASEVDAEPLEAIEARTKSTAVLIRETKALIDDIDAGRVRDEELVANVLQPRLSQFRASFPGVTNAQLAEMLEDRSSPFTKQIIGRRMAELRDLGEELEAEDKQLNADIDRYNARAATTGSTDVFMQNGNSAYLSQEKQSLERKQAALHARFEAYAATARGAQGLLEQGLLEDIREPLFNLASETRKLDQVRQEFTDANAANPKGFIKTPSIVVSWDSKEALSTIGGHNVDARALLFEASRDVEGLALVDDGLGNVVLRYNPSYAEAVETHATELARAVEHRGERDVSALMKLAQEPINTRPRREALQLAPMDSPRTSFGQLGTRVYLEKKSFVEDLRKLAEDNDCCIFVARDERQVAYVAEPHFSPPPSIRTIEIRDTPSLVDHLARWSRRAGTPEERAVIFFDEQESHVQALAADATDAANASLAKVVAAVGEHATKTGSGDIAGIIHFDLNGQRSVLRTLGDAIGERGKALLERIGLREPKQMWRHARVTTFEGDRLDQILKAAKWNPSRDGSPTAISMSFTADGGRPIPEVALVAGFAEGDPVSGLEHLQSAHVEAVTAASIDGATLAQYLMTVRNRLRSLPDSQMRRLVMVVEDKQGRTLLTRLDLSADGGLGAS